MFEHRANSNWIEEFRPTFLFLLGAITASALYVWSLRQVRPCLNHIPVLGAELGRKARKAEMRNNARAFLNRGYREFNKLGKPFQVETTEGPMVVLNAQQTSEVGSMPDHIVDNMRPNGRALMDQYTGYFDADSVILRSIKTQLSTRLGELMPDLADQVDKCIEKEITGCKEWELVTIFPHLERIVATVSTRVFVGEELTSNEEWLAGTIDYTIQLITCATILKHLPTILLPLVYRFIPAYRKLQNIKASSKRLIKPIIQSRRERMERPGYVGGNNMLQWMLDERVKKSFQDRDYETMAQFQLQLAFASLHTTSMALVNMIFDLVAWPSYIDILRAELTEQMEKTDGKFNREIIHSLPKMDSFMKESQRHNPVGYTIMGRDICRDITLSDGTFLPKGTFVTANGYHITHDPEVLLSGSDPDMFDGLRYYNLRNTMIKNGQAEKAVAGKHQFVSISNSSLMFGYGKHACPGRFFAGNETKLLLAKLLLGFDFKLPPGEYGRYRSKSWEVANYPDAEKRILMKRR